MKHEIKCPDCGEVYPLIRETPIMLLQPGPAFDYPPNAIVINSYDTHCYKFMKKVEHGVIMDFGSGNNPEFLDNLIKFDTLAFPNVEVVGDVETLPFKKESFHLIISREIFGRLHDPFLVANNLQEVLVEDGEIYIEVGLLAPGQAFPKHFLNVPKRGIEEIFSNFEKVDSGTRPDLYQSLTLSRILNAWVNTQTPEEREEFLNTTVGDIQAEYAQNALNPRWMKKLHPSDREELGSGVFFLGRKYRSDSKLHPVPLVKKPHRQLSGSFSTLPEGDVASPLLSRFDKVMSLIDKKGLGLEIGPSHQPIAPKKLGFNVHILDVGSTEEIRKKFKELGVSIEEIEEVDFIWDGEALSELIGQEQCYDWIIASHVIEHVPDMISFLTECEKLLRPSGVLSLVIPDKRYCFDYFQSTTSTGEILDAFDQKRTRPSPGKVFDFCSRFVKSNGQSIWGPPDKKTQFEFANAFAVADLTWQRARTTDDYFDVHNWRFTPSSFRLLLGDLRALRLTGFGIQKEFDTTGCEFYVTLGKNAENISIENSNRLELLRRIRDDDETTT